VTLTGDHYLGFTFIGYKSHEMPLTLPYGDELIDIGQVILSPLALELQEVEVAATERKKIKPDIDSGVCIQEIRDEQTVQRAKIESQP